MKKQASESVSEDDKQEKEVSEEENRMKGRPNGVPFKAECGFSELFDDSES